MEVMIKKGYWGNDALRKSFNELAGKTFGLSFEGWYQNGFWTDKYIPYSVIHGNKVIANISVNRMDFKYDGEMNHYIQLGTIMTDERYRKQGFSRMLMDIILKEYASCDGIYLYANDSVLDFYPRFGFTAKKQFRYFTDINCAGERNVKFVPMKTKDDWASFLQEKNIRNSLGIADMKNDELLMFYLTQFMQNNVFYLANVDSYVIAEMKEDTLVLFDVFSKGQVPVKNIWEEFGKEIKKVIFSFVPKDTNGPYPV